MGQFSPRFPTGRLSLAYTRFHSTPYVVLIPPSTQGSSASQQSSSRLPEAPTASDSESEIDPFVGEEEREELLGDLDSENEEEDSSDEDGPPPSKKIKLSSPKTVSLLQAVMEKPLKNEKRKKFTAKFPLPSCNEAHTPKLDEAIACIVPKSAKTYDRFLSKLQQFSLDALGPMIWLYDQMSSEKGVDASKAKAAVESSIALLGNATSHFSTERRKCLMKHLNKDLCPLCEGKFPNRGACLFGDNFGSKAKKTADNIRALKGVSSAKERFSQYGGPNKGKQPQGRRYFWGKNTQSTQSSIFNRLGPAKQAPANRNNRPQQSKKQ